MLRVIEESLKISRNKQQRTAKEKPTRSLDVSSGESVGAVFPDPAGPNDSSEVSGVGSPLVIALARAPSTTDLQDCWSHANWQTTGDWVELKKTDKD